MKALHVVLLVAGAAIAGGVVGHSMGVESVKAPVATAAVTKPNVFDQFDPPAALADDQIARINADLARDRQVEDDAKVQARALADELRK